MKSTIVPAQITTVEDKIAGNLSFPQILLMLGALFIGVIIYMILPQPMKFTLYKIPLIIISTTLSLMLAIRIQGRIILQWLLVIATFAARPQFYTVNKNDISTRDIFFAEKKKKTAKSVKKTVHEAAIDTPFADLAPIAQLARYSEKNVRLRFKKGGVDVSVS